MLGSTEPVGRLIGTGDRRGLTLGLAVVVVLVALGLALGEGEVPALAVIVAPFVACATARWRAVAVVGLGATVGMLVLVAAYDFDPLHVAIRLAGVVLSAGLACWLSWERQRRDRTTQLLRERNELALRFELLLREAPVGFILADTQLHILVVNDKLAAFRDLDPEDFLGKRLSDVDGVSHAASELEQAMAGVLLSGSPVLGLPLADGDTAERGTREFEA
ncbi:hypothetical protein B7486_56500, partial [cyanobacterium TDX16]